MKDFVINQFEVNAEIIRSAVKCIDDKSNTGRAGRKPSFIVSVDIREMNKFRCKQCEDSGVIDYKIYEGVSTRTCLGWIPTYDRNGVLLNRDPNQTKTNMSCSNGHKWVYSE